MRLAWVVLVLCGCSGAASPVVTTAGEQSEPTIEQSVQARRQAACSAPLDEPARPQLIAPPQVAEGLVGRLEIEGAVRVTTSKIRESIDTGVGDKLDAKQLAVDVEQLWRTGQFDDVGVHVSGSPGDLSVVFRVRERPLIGYVFTEGADDIDVLEASEPHARSHASKVVSSVAEGYVNQGYRRATVELRQRRPEPGIVDLCFVVERGPRAFIDEIAFEGNQAFDDARLRSLLALGKVLDQDLLDRGVLYVSAHYFDHGYLLHTLSEPAVTLSKDGTKLSLRIDVVEGPQFRVGKVEVAGPLNGYPPLETQSGAVFSRTAMGRDVELIREAHGNRDETVQVSAAMTPDQAAKRVDVTFQVE